MVITIVVVTAFIGVAALVGGIAFMFRGVGDTPVEDRLEVLTNTGNVAKKAGKRKEADLLAHALNHDKISLLETFVSRFLNLRKFLDQADVNIKPAHFVLIMMGLMAAGGIVMIVAGLHPLLAPMAALTIGLLPFIACFFRRKHRFAAFQKQLPEALELIARALRAGHSLAAGMKLVADEMPAPMGAEFGRVYEEQNLGVPLEEALDSVSDRIPNLDLRFFTTAVILQRQTGGDLAEILDKIGRLIRERFRIWGAIQALTGEGRISGVVLLGLPPVLFLTIYYINPDYIQILFTDPLGGWMLGVTVALQIVGALVIRKIINIKV
ncbi:MAG: type II secretion system F family protein [Pirellulaceae bacterium]|nr:type II secretion system F family protein [Pirellulaceae bacterium]